jgi:hypothetical protein
MYAGPEGTEASESVNYFMNSLVILNEPTEAGAPMIKGLNLALVGDVPRS